MYDNTEIGATEFTNEAGLERIRELSRAHQQNGELLGNMEAARITACYQMSKRKHLYRYVAQFAVEPNLPRWARRFKCSN